MIEECREVDIEVLPHQAPIASLIPVQLFRGEVAVGVEACEKGYPGRGCPDIAGKKKVLLRTRWGSDSMRVSRPHCLFCGGSPHHSNRRFQFEAGEICAKKFGACNQ